MKKLRDFLNSKKPEEQQDFAVRSGTTIGYLRKAISAKQKFSDGLCIALERESGGAVRCEDLRSDIDWAYLRGTTPQPATESEIPPLTCGTGDLRHGERRDGGRRRDDQPANQKEI